MAFNHVDRDYSIVPVTVTQLVALSGLDHCQMGS